MKNMHGIEKILNHNVILQGSKVIDKITGARNAEKNPKVNKWIKRKVFKCISILQR